VKRLAARSYTEVSHHFISEDIMGTMGEFGLGFTVLRDAATSALNPELADLQIQSRLAGLGYRVVSKVFLLEVGDEYFDIRGKFSPVPLACVGMSAPEGTLVRRLERRLR
jgi:hypothetical protein